jgi:hypothetical protein
MSGHSNGPPVKRWKQAPLNFESSRRSFLKVQGYYRQTIITLKCELCIASRWPSLAIRGVGFTVPQLAQIDLSSVGVPLSAKQTNVN